MLQSVCHRMRCHCSHCPLSCITYRGYRLVMCDGDAGSTFSITPNSVFTHSSCFVLASVLISFLNAPISLTTTPRQESLHWLCGLYKSIFGVSHNLEADCSSPNNYSS
jgi:hypothetical protein